MSFDVELERDVIAHALKDKRYLGTACALMERHHFSSERLAWVWEVLSEVYDKNRELPSPSIFFTRIDRDYEDEDKREHMEEVLAGLYARKAAAPKSALDEIRRFIKMAVARRASDEMLDGIDDGDLDAVESAFDEGMAEIRRASVLDTPVSWIGGAKERLSRYESYGKPGGRYAFKTMLETINHRAIPIGGLPAGKIAEVLATTNVGKTTFLVDIGYNALVRSHAAVLHVTTEDPREEVELRYDARITGIKRTKLESGGLTASDKKKFLRTFADHEHIQDLLSVHYLPKGHKVSVIGPLVEMMRERHPRKGLLLVYDSPYHAQGIRHVKERRHELREVAEYLDNLTKDESLGLGDVSVWFSHHGRRKDAGKVPTAESGAESYDIERIVDFMVGLREGDTSDGTEEVDMECWVTKNRLGPLKRAIIYMKADLEICKFREVAYHELADDEDEDE